MLATAVCVLLLPALLGAVPTTVACQPSIRFASRVADRDRGEILAVQVTVEVDAAAASGNQLNGTRITQTSNALVEVNGARWSASTIPLGPRVTSTSFVVRKVTRGQPFMAQYVATDACGDVPRFAGAGMGGLDPAPEASPTATMTPTTTATALPAIATQTFTPTPVPTSSPSVTATATLTSPPVLGPDATVPGALRLTATFNSIGVEVPFTYDRNANATVNLAFKRAADTAWRPGLPLWRTDDGTAPAFFGSALLLEPGTTYDVRLTVVDPDGIAGPATVVGTVSTRAENIPTRESLVPTHFVSIDGDDANAGTSRAAAWRTLDRMVRAAPPGAIVEVGPGHFLRPALYRTQPLTVLAAYPAVNDANEPVNANRRTVIEGGQVSSPEGTYGPNHRPWTPVTLVGPGRGGAPSGASYTVWKWSKADIARATHIGYASTPDEMPRRVVIWRTDASDLATPAGWAEKLFTNRSYNYGAYQVGEDLYLRLPPNAPSADPNQLYITAGYGFGFRLEGAGSRVSGFEIRMADHGVWLGPGSNGVVDHNLLLGNGSGVSFGGRAGPPTIYGSDHVVEHNRIVDSNLWTDDHTGQPAIPWAFIKSSIKNADGSTYGTKAIGAYSSSDGISGKGTGQRIVIRRNTIEGTFNGVGDGANAEFDRSAAQDMDIHDNLLRRIADDAIEPEGVVINFRVWNNRVEQTSTLLSTGPVELGPIYVFRNVVWRTGNSGVGRYNDGSVGMAGRVFKYSGTSIRAARIFVLHNTIWTDQSTPNAISGGSQSASTGPDTEAFYLRNNIIRVSMEAFDAPTAPGKWDEDYNHFSTSDPARGLKFGARFGADVAGYRTASGQGAHTNVSSSFVAPPSLLNPTAGDLRLPPGSPLIDAGARVPNLSDRADVDFAGSAPDLGARER
jgi:hypothetical protein